MKIGIQAWGTDGDIGPLVAIAVELAQRNHIVMLEILPFKKRDFSFLNEIKKINLRITEFPQEKYTNENRFSNMEIWDPNNEETGKIIGSRFECIKSELRESALRISETVDVILGTQHTLFLNSIAAAKDIPYFSLAYEHSLIPSIYSPPVGQTNISIEDNIKAWAEYEKDIQENFLESINTTRQLLGAPDVTSILEEVLNSRLLNIVSYSPTLFPWEQKDWKETHKTCGYIYSDHFNESWEPSTELKRFIEEGPAPILVCLSSMIIFENNLSKLQEMIINALEKAKVRAVFLSDWTLNNESVSNIFKLTGFVNLTKILPQCALIIHAGGAGFTHDAAKSGTPSIVIPYGFDQIYNAEILKAHGLCKFYIRRAELSIENLLSAIKNSLYCPELAHKAKSIAALMAHENGVLKAADAIEEKYLELYPENNEVQQLPVSI